MSLIQELHRANSKEVQRVKLNEELWHANIARLKKLGVDFEDEESPETLFIKVTGERWKRLPEGLPDRCLNLWVNDTAITSLEGCPKHVANSVVIRGNRSLESLKHAPLGGEGSYLVHENSLTSLAGCPKHVGKDFACHFNRLSSFDGAPETIVGKVRLFGNKGVRSLEGLGTKYFREVGHLIVSGVVITSHALGLLLVKGEVQLNDGLFKDVPSGPPQASIEALKIIKKYLDAGGGHENLIDCQHELIDAGYDEMAKL